MGKLAKSLENSIWYASKILNGTRYAEQNWKVRGTPWGEGVIASITLDEKSFLFGLFPDQESEVNKLVLMEMKYYIYYARCSNNNMGLTVLKNRLKLLYQTNRQASIIESKDELFQTKWQKYHALFE